MEETKLCLCLSEWVTKWSKYMYLFNEWLNISLCSCSSLILLHSKSVFIKKHSHCIYSLHRNSITFISFLFIPYFIKYDFTLSCEQHSQHGVSNASQIVWKWFIDLCWVVVWYMWSKKGKSTSQHLLKCFSWYILYFFIIALSSFQLGTRFNENSLASNTKLK